jgi:hypothetical protein
MGLIVFRLAKSLAMKIIFTDLLKVANLNVDSKTDKYVHEHLLSKIFFF